jgi:serine/threonine protein kinase
MTDEQWRRAWEIYAEAAELDGEEQQSFVRSLDTDREVLEQVTSILEEPEEADTGAAMRDAASRSGSRFGRYEISDLLSCGGMGEVYLAGDPELGRKVAIKFLHHSEWAAGAPAVERLVREAKAASALNHPHIITVYDVIRENDHVALVMELVEGRALRAFCGKPLEIAWVIDWGRQIAQALAAAHQRHIIHRDVKPENVMVREDGILKVLDFGLADQAGGDPRKSSDSLGLAGTLDYMSPELTRGKRATSASDVFSLGLVLYELAAGTHPFRSESWIDTAQAIAQAEPRPPSSLNRKIPAKLETLLLRMLSKDPGKRPSAAEVDRQLLLAGPVRRRRRAGAIQWAAAALILLAISGVLAYAIRGKLLFPAEPRFVQLTRQVSDNRVTTAALSPDGKTLLFATLDGLVYERRMSDGLSRPLDDLKGLRIDRMVWFHDASKILINGSRPGALDKYEPGIWVMPAEGGRLEQVASEARNGVPSPDGSRIAFTSVDGSLLSMASLTSGQRREVWSGSDTATFSTLVWSPDGKRIAFQRVEYVPPAGLNPDPKSLLALYHYRYDYLSVDVDSRQQAAFAKDFIMSSACGLQDGRVLFLRSTIDRPANSDIWTLRTDPHTGKFLDGPRQFTHYDYNLTEISTSADGQTVVAVRGVNGHPNVYVADLPAAAQYPRFTRIRRVTFTDADEYPHAWTPDSRSVIFESSRNGNFDLFRQEVDQSGAQPLAISKDTKVLAHVSPQGKWVLYNLQHEKGPWTVMRIGLQGGPAETVVTGAELAGEYNCSAQPSGRCVLRTVQNDQFQFWDLDPMLGKGRELARTHSSPAMIADWDISPDGSQVAIPSHDPRDAKIRVAPLDARGGAAERTVSVRGLGHLLGVVWAANGRGWYVAVDEGVAHGLLFYVDLEGRIVTNLMESKMFIFAVPSPDGRHVAFPDWTASGNVWRVDGL